MMDQKIYDEASKNTGEEMAALFCKTHRDLVIQREAIKRVLGLNIFNYLFCLTHLPYYEKTLH